MPIQFFIKLFLRFCIKLLVGFRFVSFFIREQIGIVQLIVVVVVQYSK